MIVPAIEIASEEQFMSFHGRVQNGPSFCFESWLGFND